MLPLPDKQLTIGSAEEQIQQLSDYVMQLKKQLDFALSNIDEANLTPAFLAKLGQGGARGE